jgi:predicted MFS family arabinose efflux permease
MESGTITSRSAPGAESGATLSAKATFFLLASMTISFLAGSAAPTPLYPMYAAEWGLTPVAVTAIFGIYALAVLAALLIGGRLSDHLGRRPVLLAASIGQLLSMVLYASAHDATGLVMARVFQGLVTGASVAAIGAAMIDIDKTRGALANAVAPAFGTGSGAILGGLFVQFLPAPTHLIYEVLGVVFIVQAVSLSFMSETITPRSGVLQSLKPQLALPRATREPLLLAVPVLIAAWATAGFYGSLGPMLIRGLLNTHSPLLGGLGLFVLSATAGVSVLVLRHREPKHMMTLGAVGLAVGAAFSTTAISEGASLLFFLGTALAGVGFGAGFQGSVRTVVPFAAAHERAGVLSILFLVSYLAMGAPAVVAGALVARHGNILAVAQGFGAVVIALAVAALIGGAVRDASKRPRK